MARSHAVSASLAALLHQLGSDKSRTAYAGDWRRFVEWLGKESVGVLEARPRHVKQYVAQLVAEDKSRATIGRALSVIREVYAALVSDEVIETNPAREVKKPKVDKAPRTPWLDEGQVRRLLTLPAVTWDERRTRVCLCLLLGLGWRRAEVANLRVEDFARRVTQDEDGKPIVRVEVTGIVKGGKRITVGVPAWLDEEVKDWREFAGIERGPLLPRSPENRAKVSGDIVYQIVKGAAVAVGLPEGMLTPHALRRTNITLSGMRGVSLKERQLAVGHGSSAVTERYDKDLDATRAAPGEVLADLVRR